MSKKHAVIKALAITMLAFLILLSIVDASHNSDPHNFVEAVKPYDNAIGIDSYDSLAQNSNGNIPQNVNESVTNYNDHYLYAAYPNIERPSKTYEKLQIPNTDHTIDSSTLNYSIPEQPVGYHIAMLKYMKSVVSVFSKYYIPNYVP
jgi:hypothetical protein